MSNLNRLDRTGFICTSVSAREGIWRVMRVQGHDLVFLGLRGKQEKLEVNKPNVVKSEKFSPDNHKHICFCCVDV